MSKNINVYFNLSAVESKIIYNDPLLIKGESTVNFVLTGVKEDSYNVLFLDINWGDGSTILTKKRDAVYNYREQSIFDEILYGKIGGSVCVLYPYRYSNQTSSYCLNLTSCFTLTYNSGEIVYFYQPLQVYQGSFYDDVIDLVAISTQILPTSANTTFVNFESKNDIQIIPSLLTANGQYTNTLTIALPQESAIVLEIPAPVESTPEVEVIPEISESLTYHLFTASSIPISVSSNINSFTFSLTSGINPIITLMLNINYDFIVNTTLPFAIRSSPLDSTTVIPEIYNNNIVSGVTNSTLMATFTSAKTLYYVDTSTPSISGIINII